MFDQKSYSKCAYKVSRLQTHTGVVGYGDPELTVSGKSHLDSLYSAGLNGKTADKFRK